MTKTPMSAGARRPVDRSILTCAYAPERAMHVNSVVSTKRSRVRIAASARSADYRKEQSHSLLFVIGDRPPLEVRAPKLRLRFDAGRHDSLGPVAARVVLILVLIVLLNLWLFFCRAHNAVIANNRPTVATAPGLGNRVVVIVVLEGRTFFRQGPDIRDPLQQTTFRVVRIRRP